MTPIWDLQRSGNYDVLSLQKDVDFIWKVIGGFYTGPKEEEDLAKAIIAGGWTYTFKEKFNFQ